MNLEKTYLALVFALLLYLGVSNLFDHRLKHEFPYGYGASDTFQQQTRVEGIEDAGNYRLEPFYIVKGYKDVIGYYPPIIHHLGIVLHFASGIPAYDTIYFMVFFNAILAALVMYLIIRKYSKHIAMLALPLSILIFSSKTYVGFLWGHWASITGQLFLICTFWALSRIEIEKSEILLGLFIGALALSHTSELVYGVGFIIIYGIWLILRKRFTSGFVKKIIIAGIISGLIGSYNLFVFANSFMVVNPYQFEVSKDWGGTPILNLSDFRLLLLFMGLGLVVSVVMLKKFDLAVLAGLYMLGIGYTNYIGFGIRAFQPRLLWPIYLSFFFGLGIYTIIGLVPQKFRLISVLSLSSLFLILFSNVIALPNVPTYSKISSSGLMDKWHWDAFQWISEKTDQDDKIYFFYGDVYDQDAILRNSKRVHGQVVPEFFVELIQNRSIKRIYKTEFPADHGAGMPYKKSFLKIGLHLKEPHDSLMWQDRADVCIFDYFVFDKLSRQKVLSDFNLLIANEMLSKGAQDVFQNELVVILKNNKVGADCIEERSF
ncbi:MAG: hypothetical protein AABX33_05540 [Nanoarchaeota archaeon]